MAVPAMARGVLLIDFDATIYPFAPLDDDGPPIRGAVDAIRSLKEAGYTIRIFSSRLSETWLEASGEHADEQLALMAWRLGRDGIPFDGFAFDKEPAQHYIDDRAIEFRDNWEAIAARLLWARSHADIHSAVGCACGEDI